MRSGEQVFVDTGAWVALALTKDPLHSRAVEAWQMLLDAAARLKTSVPVVLETFTFLDRNAHRDVALAWREALAEALAAKPLECRASDLEESWPYFRRTDLHKLSAVDATSFVLMKREKIRVAFAYDHHFGSVGFRLVG